jgi:hypothetical protein
MKVRSIPPITSTGRNTRKTAILHPGLANMSLGRYMSEMARIRKNEDGGEAWGVANFVKSEFNRRPEKKPVQPPPFFSRQNISAKVTLSEHSSEADDYTISLMFAGLVLAGGQVSPYQGELGKPAFMIPVSPGIRDKESYLLLTTIGDIFDYEVVRDVKQCCLGKCLAGYVEQERPGAREKAFCPNRLFRGETYIPGLLEHFDPMSMQVKVQDNLIIVTYLKITG